MQSKDYIKINGVSSDTINNLYIDTPPIPPKAKQKYNSYAVGRDENYIVSDSLYEDISYQIKAYSFDSGSDYSVINDIYEFLSEVSTLEISRLSGYEYRVRQCEVKTSFQQDSEKIKYTIDFKLSPFRYSTDNEEVAVYSGEWLENNGSRHSYPTIRISGAGETDFIFNENVFKLYLSDSGQNVIIDTEHQVVYDYNSNEILYNISSGDFPVLLPGDNYIIWYKQASVYLKKNERWY